MAWRVDGLNLVGDIFRSYGRPPKTVHIEASFVPYDEDILPKETDKTLVSRPYYHIFQGDSLVVFYCLIASEIWPGEWMALIW
jgi:hypothetical protein